MRTRQTNAVLSYGAVLVTLGNLETFTKSIPTILRGLHRLLGDEVPKTAVELENLDHVECGVTLAVNALWEELGLTSKLRQCFRARCALCPTELLVRTMFTNRLSEPTSKLGIARSAGFLSECAQAGLFACNGFQQGLAFTHSFLSGGGAVCNKSTVISRYSWIHVCDFREVPPAMPAHEGTADGPALLQEIGRGFRNVNGAELPSFHHRGEPELARLEAGDVAVAEVDESLSRGPTREADLDLAQEE